MIEFIIFLASLWAILRLASWDTKTNLLARNKDKCVVWVNMQIIHDKVITKYKILDFITEKFPGASPGEIKIYFDYIRELLGNKYSDKLSVSDSWRVYIDPNKKHSQLYP